MKRISALLLLSVLSISTHGQVIFGPITSASQCPGPGRGQTQGNVKYCYFDDPRIIQVINAPCPSGLRGGSNSSIGNQKWCVIRK